VGANPVDRGKPGSKLHLVCDGGGLPLTGAVTGANVNDTTMLQAVVDDVPPVRTSSGRRRTKPGTLHADKGYDLALNARVGMAWIGDKRLNVQKLRPATGDLGQEAHDSFGRSPFWIKVRVVHAKAPPASAADAQRR
jgi:Transposase DDE domain